MRQYLRYSVPEKRVRLDWRPIESIAQTSFAELIRISIESHLTWYRDQQCYYDSDWNPNDYKAALEALEKVTRTIGQRERWQGMEGALETVVEALKVFSRPFDDEFELELFGAYQKSHNTYFLLFQLWECLGEAGVKRTQLRGVSQSRHGNDKVLTVAQLCLREICNQGVENFSGAKSDQAFAKDLKRALKRAEERGDRAVLPVVPVSGLDL